MALRLRSLNISTPQAKEMSTEPLLTRDTTEIIDSGALSALKYAKSAVAMNMDISGIAQLQWKGVVAFRLGYQSKAHMTVMMISW